ncbi:glycoside hydrolase family 25 protein [Actinophytocola sediminis]
MAVTFGLDISHHQGAFDLARAAREGVAFVILKATEGNGFTDSRFAGNLASARRAGLLVAAYHYQRGNVSAAAQVAHVRRVVPLDVPVIPDVEANSGTVALTRDLVARLRAAGYRVPLLYLPRWYWQQIGSPSLAGLPPLWSSRYPDNVAGSIPDEWGDVPSHYWQGYGGLPVALLQFTSSAAVAGRSPIDANAYRGTRDEFAALLEEDDDMPTAREIADAFLNTVLDMGWTPPGGKTTHKANVRTVLAWEDRRHQALVAQLAGVVGKVEGLAEAVRQLGSGDELDLAAVTVAAESGTRKALDEGTVRVDIDVTGPDNQEG